MAGLSRYLPWIGTATEAAEMQNNQIPMPAGASIPRRIGGAAREYANQIGRNVVDTGRDIAGAATYLPREFAAGFSPETKNAVATATGAPPSTGTTTGPQQPTPGQLTGPVDTKERPYDYNMPNGSIQVVSQPAGYPGAPQQGAGTAITQSPNQQFASFDNFNTVQLGVNRDGGNAYKGDVGLFSPGISSQMSQLTDRANTLLSSRSMVDNWRGRQLAKMRDRMMLSESAMANARSGQTTAQAHMLGSQASALRAANEVPLAQMHDYTAQRGQNFQRETGMANVEAHRYATDVGASTQERAQDIGLLPKIGESAISQVEAQAVQAGDWQTLERIAEHRGKTKLPHEEKVTADPMGRGYVVTPAGGQSYLKTFEDFAAESKRAREEAAAAKINKK
jgi:hypothetical protein